MWRIKFFNLILLLLPPVFFSGCVLLAYILILWWCTKIVNELIVYICANGCTWRTKEKNQSKGTGGVLAKDPSNVKLVIEEFPRTQECQNYGEFTYLKKGKAYGLYRGRELPRIP